MLNIRSWMPQRIFIFMRHEDAETNRTYWDAVKFYTSATAKSTSHDFWVQLRYWIVYVFISGKYLLLDPPWTGSHCLHSRSVADSKNMCEGHVKLIRQTLLAMKIPMQLQFEYVKSNIEQQRTTHPCITHLQQKKWRNSLELKDNLIWCRTI